MITTEKLKATPHTWVRELSGAAVALSLFTCIAVVKEWPMPFMPLAAGVWCLSKAARRARRNTLPIVAFFLVVAAAIGAVLVMVSRW